MSSFLEITADDITRLDSGKFIDFMTSLLRVEANKVGISPLSVKITASSKKDVKDRGIDARIESPSTESVWQFKSGECTPAELKKQAKKPGVIEAVEAGATYCVAHGAEYSDSLRRRRENAIKEGLEEEGVAPRYRYYIASQIAQWATEYEALVRSFRPIDKSMLFHDWASNRQHSIPFHPDEERGEIITQFREVLTGQLPRNFLRIEGQGGVGKTRLALEIVNSPGLKENVMYAPSFEDIPDDLYGYLRNNPKKKIILIVDECSSDEATSVKTHLESTGEGVHLITIGPRRFVYETMYVSQGYVCIKPLAHDAMEELLKQVGGLPQPAIDWIIRASEGFVKIATRLAEHMQEHPDDMSASRLAKAPDIQEILEKLVPDPEIRIKMQFLSLLTEVGWDNELSGEGEFIRKFFRIDPTDFRHAIRKMEKEGLVSRRGRKRYVTPHLLAVWLADALWDTYDYGTLTRFFSQLPSRNMREVFWERISDLGDNERTRQFVKDILSQFKVLSDIDNEEASNLINQVAASSPQDSLDKLEGLIGHLPRDDLLRFRAGRRNVIWALEKLAWNKETFHGAARLLLALADAENESYGNNASSIWVGLFRTRLGGTEVPALERYIHIEEAIASGSKEKQKLAVKAIGVALSEHETRFSSGERQGGRIVGPEWRPKTLEEYTSVKRETLALLDNVLQLPDKEIQDEAVEILLHQGLGLLPLFPDEVLKRVFALPVEDYKRKREIRNSLEFLLKREEYKVLNDDQKNEINQKIEELRGKNFHDRFRRWTGPLSRADFDAARQKDKKGVSLHEKESAKLAEEAYANPTLLEPELDWLFSKEAQHGGYFMRQLGKVDKELKFFDLLIERVKHKEGVPDILAIYLAGRTEAGATKWVEELLDKWSLEEPELAYVVLHTTWRSKPTSRAVRRLAKMVENNFLEPKSLSLFVWGAWTNDLDLVDFKAILNQLIKDPTGESMEETLTMLDFRLRSNEKEHSALSNSAWMLIELAFRYAGTHRIAHEWGQIARKYVNEDPVRMANLIIDWATQPDTKFYREDEYISVLSEAARKAPREIWERIGEILKLRYKKEGYFAFSLALRKRFAFDVPSDVLLEWADKNKPEGPRVVAEITHPGGANLNPLARELLIKYYEEDSKVGSILASNLWHGEVITGSMAKWDESMRDMAIGWAKDSNPTVKRWAKEVAKGLEADRKRDQLKEDEGWI